MQNPPRLSYLLYTYLSPKRLSKMELEDSLRSNHFDRAMLGLSGRCLYMETRFICKAEGRVMEYVEGEEKKIHQHYQLVASDSSKLGLIILGWDGMKQRFFRDWKMSFEHNPDTPPDIETFEPLSGKLFGNGPFSELSSPLAYLRYFYEYNLQITTDRYRPECYLQQQTSISITELSDT